jgi:glycosyltransferase involved in cell wall biosynthesis
MHVGIYVKSSGPTVGGGFTYAEEFLKAISEIAPTSGHSFTALLTANLHLNISYDNENKSLSVVRIPTSLAFRGLTKVTGMLLDAARIFGIEPRFQFLDRRYRFLVHHKIDFLFCVGGHPLGYSLDIPYAIVVWDLQHRLQPWFPEVSAGKTWEVLDRYYSRVLRRATFVLTGTKVGAEEIHDFFQVPRDRIRVVPFPAPSLPTDISDDERRAVMTKFGIDEDFVLYPANFWPHKNHVNLLLAIRNLSNSSGLSISVVFTGSDKGNLSHVMRTASDLNMASRVRALGFVSREDLSVLYQEAIALVFVSMFGPDNLPPLEAFALGCPVIAADVPGTAEQLGDAAILVNPLDPDEIARAIRRVIECPQIRRGLVERGLARSQELSRSRFAASLAEVVNSFEAIRRCWK